MTLPFIPRMLLQTTTGKATERPYSSLDPKDGPIVVLGEAGMGKSRLLEQLNEDHGWPIHEAKAIEWQPSEFRPDLLLIDALDEYPASTLSEALTKVLKGLVDRGCQHFILTCRASDWSEAEHASIITAAFHRPPRQLRLAPLSEAETEHILDQVLPAAEVSSLLTHLQRHGLSHWLGNPQTLSMVIESVKAGPLPSSRGALFEQATHQLIREHNNAKAKKELPPQIALALAGAVCAALVVTGKTAVSRLASGNLHRDDLSINELLLLPHSEHLERLLDCRLFTAVDVDRFQCTHRSIAEYLAGTWLQQQAGTSMKQRRLLAMFHQQGIVPSHLRAVHAWLAKNSDLTKAVIEKDPISFVEHGDIAALNVNDAAALLDALKVLHAQHPEALSYWRPHSAQGLIHNALSAQLLQIITDPHQSVHFRIFVLEALADSDLTAQFKETLSKIVLESTEAYGVRATAAAALAPLLSSTECLHHTRTASATGHNDCIRIALDLCCLTAFAHISDEVIADLINASVDQPQRFGECLDKLSQVNDCLPAARIAGVMDNLVTRHPLKELEEDEPCDPNLYELVSNLTLKALADTQVSAANLWQWFLYLYALRPVPLDCEIQEYLHQNTARRQGLQWYVLFEDESPRTFQQKSERLRDIGYRVDCSESDAIVLLGCLCPQEIHDDRWKDLVTLIYHIGDSGSALRTAAQAFACASPERTLWLDALKDQATQRQDAHERERINKHQQNEQVLSLAEQALKRHKDAIEQIREGNAEYLLTPARIYLDLPGYVEIGNSGYDRLVNWGGEALASAVLSGFDAYLNSIPQTNAINDMGYKLAEVMYAGTRRTAEFSGLSPAIVLAAVNQRAMTEAPLSDLPDGALLAAFLACSHMRNSAAENLDERIDDALAQRGLLKEALRLCIEPNLMIEEAWLDLQLGFSARYEEKCRLIAELACTWLKTFQDLPDRHQLPLFNHIWEWSCEQIPPLLSLYAEGLLAPRPAFFDAAQLIEHFAETSIRLDRKPVEEDLFIKLMELRPPRKSIDLITWVFARFRSAYPTSSWIKGNVIDHRSFHSHETMYLHDLILQLVYSPSPAARDAINSLCQQPCDSYTNALIEAQESYLRKHNEPNTITLADIIAITQDLAPQNEFDLQAYMLEHLEDVQRKIVNDELNSWSLFYQNSKLAPHKEDDCRNRVVLLLKQAAREVDFSIEQYVVDSKRVDFMCECAGITLPVEVKLAWNPTIWTATDKQLDALYTSYYRNPARLGIYLVLWFGEQGRKTPKPKDGSAAPETATDLAQMIVARSAAAREGRVKVVVLDLSRKPTA